jgi:hypothetical protein
VVVFKFGTYLELVHLKIIWEMYLGQIFCPWQRISLVPLRGSTKEKARILTIDWVAEHSPEMPDGWFSVAPEKRPYGSCVREFQRRHWKPRWCFSIGHRIYPLTLQKLFSASPHGSTWWEPMYMGCVWAWGLSLAILTDTHSLGRDYAPFPLTPLLRDQSKVRLEKI